MRSYVVALKPLNLFSSVSLQLAAYAFGSSHKGHGDIAVTNAQPTSQHTSIIAQVEAL